MNCESQKIIWSISAGGCDWRSKRGREEPPHVRGRRPREVTSRLRSGAAAESTRLRQHRNGRDKLPRVRGQGGRPRGDTQRPRSGAAMRGVTLLPRAGAAGRRSYPTLPRPRPGAADGRTNPTSKEPWLCRRRRA